MTIAYSRITAADWDELCDEPISPDDMPGIGYGTWTLAGADASEAVRWAIEHGWRARYIESTGRALLGMNAKALLRSLNNPSEFFGIIPDLCRHYDLRVEHYTAEKTPLTAGR